MIDRQAIGRIVSRHRFHVEQGKLRFFARAIGDTEPVDACEAQLESDAVAMVVPPTYLFCLEMETPDPYAWFASVGLELPKVLHGEQSFRYWRACHAGDVLEFETRIDDVYARKAGALEFLVKSTRVVNQHGQHVADLRSVIVQRHA